MPLTAKHRSSLYQSLAPIVGDEEADALLSQLPGSEVDQLVTVGQLRAELAEVRLDLRTEIADVRVELHLALRRQTIWMVSALLTGMGVMSAVSAALTHA